MYHLKFFSNCASYQFNLTILYNWTSIDSCRSHLDITKRDHYEALISCIMITLARSYVLHQKSKLQTAIIFLLFLSTESVARSSMILVFYCCNRLNFFLFTGFLYQGLFLGRQIISPTLYVSRLIQIYHTYQLSFLYNFSLVCLMFLTEK